MTCLLRYLAAVIGLLAISINPSPSFARGESPGNFDYYLLVLSWSPSYCATSSGRRDAAQCNGERPYAFIVHGLWPQYQKGWPDFCEPAERWVPDETIASMLDIMPSKRLIIHEWRRHGTCSNLEQDDYFALIRNLFGQLNIPEKYQAPSEDIITTPDQLRSDFVAANPGLDETMIGVYCGNRRNEARLSNIRLCYTPDGKPMSCQHDRRQCRAENLILPAVRSRTPQ